MARVDTLLCDMGNVLAPFDLRRCARALAAPGGHDAELVLAHLRGPEFFAFEAGQISPTEFFAALKGRMQLGLAEAAWAEAWLDIFTLDASMVALVESLSTKVPTYLWSNGNPIHMGYLRPRLPLLQKFRGLHLSYEMGVIKPDVRFYEQAIDRAGLVPNRCVFVDDVEANLAGARALGIHTVLHRSAAQTAIDLARLGLTP